MPERSEKFVERDAVWMTMALAVAAAAIASAVLRFPINHDVGALLDLTQRSLSGERLYVDIWEPNPPLAIWLLAPPVLAAKAVHVPLATVTQVWLTAILLAALAIFYRVCCSAQIVAHVGGRRTLVFGLAFLWLGLAPYELGQRDPLTLQLTTPYLFAATGHAYGRAPARSTSIGVGVLGAIGFALKPTFLPTLLLVEAYLYMAARRHDAWRRVEIRIMGVGLASYGAFVALASGYIGAMKAGGALYGAYENAFGKVLSDGNPVLWVPGFVVLAFARRSLGGHVRALLAIGLTGCVASALVQAKGWSYHWVPAHISSLFVLVLAAVGLSDRSSGRGRAVIDVVALWFAALFTWRVYDARASRTDPRWAIVRTLAAFLKANARGGPIAWFSTSCPPAFPAITYAGVHVMMPGTWMLLPGIYAAEPPLKSPFPYHALGEMTSTERFVLDSNLRAFEARPPTLVIFDRRRFKQGLGFTTFDHYDYLRRDPRFEAAFGRYRTLLDAPELLVLTSAPPVAR
jgi:hypothetical protein